MMVGEKKLPGLFNRADWREPGGARRAASERPAPGDAIAPFDARRGADSTGGCGNEGSPIGKPIARDGLADIPAGAAHATAIADEPADRAVEGRRGLDDAHELEGRQLGLTERFG